MRCLKVYNCPCPFHDVAASVDYYTFYKPIHNVIMRISSSDPIPPIPAYPNDIPFNFELGYEHATLIQLRSNKMGQA